MFSMYEFYCYYDEGAETNIAKKYKKLYDFA